MSLLFYLLRFFVSKNLISYLVWKHCFHYSLSEAVVYKQFSVPYISQGGSLHLGKSIPFVLYFQLCLGTGALCCICETSLIFYRYSEDWLRSGYADFNNENTGNKKER